MTKKSKSRQNQSIRMPYMSLKEHLLRIQQLFTGLSISWPTNSFLHAELEEIENLSRNGNLLMQELECELHKKFERIIYPEDFQKIASAYETYAEAKVALVFAHKEIILDRTLGTGEEGQQRPDFSLSAYSGTLYFEVKSLDIVNGIFRHSTIAKEALGIHEKIEEELKSSSVAFGEFEEAPFASKGQRIEECTNRIEILIQKISDRIQQGQITHGPTILVIEMGRLRAFAQNPTSIVPVYFDDHRFPTCVSGELWQIALGRIGDQIYRYPEFEGMTNLDRPLELEGILRQYPELYGICYVIPKLEGAPDVYTILNTKPKVESSNDEPEQSISVSDVRDTIHKFSDAWNDDTNTNGFEYSGNLAPMAMPTNDILNDSFQRVVALPTIGESFLLQRDGFSILIDSGWKKDKLANKLACHLPGLECIDIAVCTHADGDHANGFPTLLDDWEKIREAKHPLVKQFWLPGTWSGVFRQLIQNREDFADKLIKEMEELIEQYPNVDSNTQIDKAIGINKNNDDKPNTNARDQSITEEKFNPEIAMQDINRSIERDAEPDWMKKLRNEFNDRISTQKEERFRENLRSRVKYRMNRAHASAHKSVGEYWLELIDTADVIRKIALSAFEHNVKIRWFEYTHEESKLQSCDGIPGLLVPINAVEQRQPPPTDSRVCYLLRLSVYNEQSLSFYSPSQRLERSGVLFCGDSPMGYGKDYSTPFKFPQHFKPHSLIATAPHHGSNSNKGAYEHISEWMGPRQVFWLRNGGSKKHPGNRYRSIPIRSRACTWCPHKGIQNRSSVEIIQQKFFWNNFGRLQVGHRCNC